MYHSRRIVRTKIVQHIAIWVAVGQKLRKRKCRVAGIDLHGDLRESSPAKTNQENNKS
jgi:hypothetical protein